MSVTYTLEYLQYLVNTTYNSFIMFLSQKEHIEAKL